MIKAIFFDIDGTLVSFRTHKMSGRLISALANLQNNGVKLFISSGRAVQSMNNLNGFPFDGYVAVNGALTLLGGKVIDSHPIPKETARRIATLVGKENAPCWVFADDLVGINLMNDRSTEIAAQVNMFPDRFVDLEKAAKERSVYEFSVFFSEEEEVRILHPVLSGVEYQRWHPYFTDIVTAGLSKSYGASKILDSLGLSADECIAFGDGGNDVPLLEYAGVGVAMGNASDEVKSKADFVTDSVDEDGIVTALERFGLLH